VTEKSGKGNELQRGERLQIMLENEELKAIDDFRFENRMPSRAAAVRELLRRGLAAIGHRLTPDGLGSSEFGVINSPRAENGDGAA
jgi:metal-responsive CopG/Arc/MetJ family transcriptional regulator